MTIQTNWGATNTGTIEATRGTLQLYGTAVNNAGGKITDNGQRLQVTGSTVNGGAVTLTGASNLQLWNGVIHTGSTLTIAGVDLSLMYMVENNTDDIISSSYGGCEAEDSAAYINFYLEMSEQGAANSSIF